jgi:hypothetical protein
VSSVTPAEDLGNGLEAELLDLGLRNKDNSGGTVVERRRVGGCDSPGARNESGLHGAELVGVEL